MKLNRIIPAVIIISIFFSCSKQEDEGIKTLTASDLVTENQRSSYTFGIDLAKNLSKSEDFEYDAFLQGFTDQIKQRPLLLNEIEMSKIRKEGEEKTKKKADVQKMEKVKMSKNLGEGKKFLNDNKQKEGVIVTSSGLQYKVINEGTGQKPKTGDTVKVHYIGSLIDGEEFDNSYKSGNPIEIKIDVDNVIKGWQEGLKLMPEGSKYMLYIPSKLAYEDNERGVIPPNSVLVFEVELLEIVKDKKMGK